MGTEAVIRIFDENKNELVNILQTTDGGPGPGGLGGRLKQIIKNIELVDGIPLDSNNNIANGMGDFAAKLIAELKESPGCIYIIPIADNDFADFTYELYRDDNSIVMNII